MSFRNKSCQISLTSIFICFFIPQVQAGFLDDVVNKAKSVTEDVIEDTVGDMANNDDKSPSSPPKASTSTVSKDKKQVEKNSTPIETAASQHSDVDIIGLKLGMTQDQVIAALKKHNKDFDITFSESKVTSNERKQDAHLPDHLLAIDAKMGDIHSRPNETIIVRFSRPPSDNTVNEIVRSVTFSQDTLTDTVVAALKEKYGTLTPKPGMLVWDFSANSNKNSNCHMMAYIGNQDRFYKSQCGGMELIAMVSTSQEILRGLQTALIDHGEIQKQMLATNNYRAQLKEERRQEKLNKASQGSAPIL